MNQQNTSGADMKAKLESYGGEMFPVTSQELTKEILIPVSYFTYKEVSTTVVTKKVQLQLLFIQAIRLLAQRARPIIGKTVRLRFLLQQKQLLMWNARSIRLILPL